MKRISTFIFLFLLLCGVQSYAQFRTFSPAGSRISLTPAVSVVNTTAETTLYSEMIPANSLVQGKYFPFRIDLALTTPAINLANLTIRIKYGSQTVAVINGAALSLNLSSATPVTITGFLVARSNTAQFLPISINQGMGSAITLGTNNATARGTMTVDATQNQNFSITAQFGGLGGAACNLLVDWVLRGDF